MLNDFVLILRWWVMLFGIGILFFPLTSFFFKKFFDLGYAFSKIAGILIISYFVWLLGSLKILPFYSETIWLLIISLIAINYWFWKRESPPLKVILKRSGKIFIIEEFLFLISLIFWSFIRGFQPDIQGLEKFMDFGFVNSILKSQFFPPADMWLAGKTINYYYFGHLITAVLTKFSGIVPEITYNLMIGSLFAFCFTAAVSLGGNLAITSIKANNKTRLFFAAGLLSAFLLVFGGNFHTLWWFLKNNNFNQYWYPDATRFIVEQSGAKDNTIHEFPIYSFVVADLHGHLLNLPFVLLFLASTFTLLLQKKMSWPLLIFSSFLLGIFYITNAWDLPIYFAFLGLVLLYLNFLKHSLTSKTIFKTLWPVLGILALAIVFSLPFHLNFKSIAKGVALTDFHSPWWMLLVLWGFPLIATFTFLIFSFFNRNNQSKLSDRFMLVSLIPAWLLILIPEFFYLKDIYIHSYQRANTMFKFTYQAFVIFSFVEGYVSIRVISAIKSKINKSLFLVLLSSALVFIFIYPYFAIKSYYGLKFYQGLYGLNFLKRTYPDDYRAVVWLKENVSNQPTIVEAVGESYTDFARVSALTGLKTILGWRVHEWLWRGSFDEPAARTTDVQEIYESSDATQTKILLEKYQVELVFIGDLERSQYPSLQEEKFKKLGKVIFSSGKTKIYKLD